METIRNVSPRPLSAKRVLLTGGAGFIGGATALELVRNGYEVCIYDLPEAIDRLTSEKLDFADQSKVHLVPGDVMDIESVRNATKGCNGVIHLAADSRVLPSLGSPTAAQRSFLVNAVGTNNVASVALEASIKIVYAGSSTAYGRRVAPQHEEDLPDILTAYAAGKLAGEHLVTAFSRSFGLSATILRYFQVYGPRQPEQGLYSLVTGIFARQAREGGPITVEGDGSQFRDFVHVDDVARANRIALETDTSTEPINIGSGVSTTVISLAGYFETQIVFLPPRRIDLPGTCADITAAQKVLGWSPKWELKRGVEQMLQRTEM